MGHTKVFRCTQTSPTLFSGHSIKLQNSAKAKYYRNLYFPREDSEIRPKCLPKLLLRFQSGDWLRLVVLF